MKRTWGLMAATLLAFGGTVGFAQEPAKPDTKPMPTTRPMLDPIKPDAKPMATEKPVAGPTLGSPTPMPTLPASEPLKEKTEPAAPRKQTAGSYASPTIEQIYPPPAPTIVDPRSGAGRQQIVLPGDPLEPYIVIPTHEFIVKHHWWDCLQPTSACTDCGERTTLSCRMKGRFSSAEKSCPCKN